MDEEDPNWRNTTVIQMDQARYHSSKLTTNIIQELKLPVMKASPYGPVLCPIELTIAQVKKGDLNPSNLPTGKM